MAKKYNKNFYIKLFISFLKKENKYHWFYKTILSSKHIWGYKLLEREGVYNYLYKVWSPNDFLEIIDANYYIRKKWHTILEKY